MELNAYTIKYVCKSIETIYPTFIKPSLIHIYIIHCSSEKYFNRLLNVQSIVEHINNIFSLNFSFVINVCTFDTLSKDNWLVINTQQKRNKLPVFAIGTIGCTLSHLWCIQYHLTNILTTTQPFIIFEDDVLLSNTFCFDIEKHILRMINDNSIGLTMLGSLDKSYSRDLYCCDEFNTYNILQSKHILGAHANLYSIDFAKQFIQNKLNYLSYIDFYKNIDKTSIVACFPPIAIQSGKGTNLSFGKNITTKELLLAFYDEHTIDTYILPNFSSKSII